MNYVQFKKDTKEFQRRADELDKVKFICQCGHRVIIPKQVDKVLCDWCNTYVFRDKSEEFKYRMQEQMNRSKDG